MRFLKETQIVTNSRSNTIIDATGGLLLPAGTTAERPTTDVADGAIRYNTDTTSLEVYITGGWENFKEPAATAIQKLTLGPTDGTETVFGPLPYQPASDDNILVWVENLFQIAGTNYDVVYSDTSDSTLIGPNEPYADGWYVVFTSAPPAGDPDPINVTVYFGFV